MASVHSQSSIEVLATGVNRPTPALLQSTCDRAERVERGLGQRLDLSELRHVGGHADRLVALRLAARPLLPSSGIAADVGQHDSHAGAGERAGDAQPDARRRPGDDGDLPLN